VGDKAVVATIDTSANIRSFCPVVDAIYEVKWVDSFGFFGWVDLSDAEGFEPSVCHTVGYVLSNNNDKIVMTQGKSTSGCVYGAIAIPVVCIQKITQLS
jgi:hypothetical protein